MTVLTWTVGTLAVLALAVAAELSARWWIRHRNEYYVLPPGQRVRNHLDPEVFPDLERVVRFDVNREGERGEELPRSCEGLYRVLVAGGSQPECFLTDQDTSWPGALHHLLQAPERLRRLRASKVHVGSIARAGVGSDALELIFERVLPRYPRLQLLVVLVGASDVLRWLERGAPAEVVPSRTAEVFRCHPEGPFGWRPGPLALRELLVRARRRWLRPVEVNPRACGWIREARTMRARAKTILTELPEPAPMLDHFEIHFRRLLERAKRHTERVLVVRQPWFDKKYSPEEAARMWHGGVGQAWRGEITTFYSFDVVSRLMSLLDARAAAVADELEVEQLDLMPLLEASLTNYYDGFHATPAGAKAVARIVAAVVTRPRPAAVGVSEVPPEVVGFSGFPGCM